MKKHQIITLLFFVWTLTICIQLQEKVRKQALTALEEYWNYTLHINANPGSGGCPETSISGESMTVTGLGSGILCNTISASNFS